MQKKAHHVAGDTREMIERCLSCRRARCDGDCAERMGAKAQAQRERLHAHDGRTMTLTAWARETGLPRKLLENRLQEGHTIGEAIAMGPKKGTELIRVDGIEDTRRGWARRLFIHYATLNNRARMMGGIEAAIRHYIERAGGGIGTLSGEAAQGGDQPGAADGAQGAVSAVS